MEDEQYNELWQELEMTSGEDPKPSKTFKGLTWNQRVTIDQVRDIKGDEWFDETKKERRRRENMEALVGCILMLGLFGVVFFVFFILKILGWV